MLAKTKLKSWQVPLSPLAYSAHLPGLFHCPNSEQYFQLYPRRIPNTKRLTLCGSLLAIAGATIGFAPSATAIPAIYRTTNQTTYLPPADQVPYILLQFTVPAGSRVISYSASAVNGGLNEIARCGVRANGNYLSNHAAQVGTQAGGTLVSTISGVTFRDSSVPYTLDLVCSHDGGGGVPYIDSGAEVAVY